MKTDPSPSDPSMSGPGLSGPGLSGRLARLPARAVRVCGHPAAVPACLLLAAVVSWTDLLIVIAGHVLPAWGLSLALLVVTPVLVRVRARRRRRELPVLELAPRRGLPRSVPVLLTFAGVTGTALGAFLDLPATYHVLDPRGPDGCKAVVREASFLLGGNGDVYAVGRTGIALWPSGSWMADDGYQPIASGTYELTWGVGGGVLMVHGRQGDPVMPALHDVDCG